MTPLSDDQKQSLFSVLSWYRNNSAKKRFITLGGYAGTGKTTLIAIIRKELNKLQDNLKVGFASYTGKAARVLKNELSKQHVIYQKDTVGTIHSLIYSPIVNDREEIVGWQPKKKLDRDLIIIDEASMVDEMIWRHLLFYDVPIIVVGDHGQLPPIKGSFNLMQQPQLRLEKIHRQAEKNPIIGLSIQAREHGMVRQGIYSDEVIKYNMSEYDGQEAMQELLRSYNNDTLILCGYNITRKKLNTHIRNVLGFESPMPMTGDRVICLRNNHRKQIFNGMIGTIVSISPADDDWFYAEIEMDDEHQTYKGLISAKQFDTNSAMNFTANRAETMRGDLFDFGYALTVHKAQGSQAKRVILFEERFKQMTDDEWKRWLYTAVTRAEEELYIFARS